MTDFQEFRLLLLKERESLSFYAVIIRKEISFGEGRLMTFICSSFIFSRKLGKIFFDRYVGALKVAN